MKVFLYFAVLAIVSSCAFAQQWKEFCVGKRLGEKVYHPHTCTKYIDCIGYGEEMDCPNKTHFNIELQVCDWPERAGCEGGGSTANPGPTLDPTQNPNPNPTSGPSPWEQYCKNQKLGKHIPHPHTCEKYIVCIGHGQEMSCPARTHFNRDLEVCDWPERAGCQDGGSTANPGPTGEPTQNPNPTGDPTSNPHPTSGPLPWKKYCEGQKLGKHVPHPHTCEKYIVCIGHGQEMSCPARTHFNKELEVCDWPERAGCQDGGSTANPGPGPTGEPTQNPNPTGEPTQNPNPNPTSGPSPWKKYCEGQKLGKNVPHPHTCEKYIVCIGHGQEMNCPARTHFNKDLEVCDWPERAGCQDGGSTANPGPGPTGEPTQNPNPTGEPTQNPNPNPTSGPSPWKKYCEGQKLGKHVPHPHTCEKYIVCIGHGQEMNCPARTHFNKDLEVCDWPERAGCQDGGSTANPGPTGEPTQNPNPTGDPTQNPHPTSGPSPWKKYCEGQKLGKHVPHPHTCEKYIVCIGHGQEMDCPARTHFNKELEVCDWPERAGCQDGGSTANPGPTGEPTQNPNPTGDPTQNPHPTSGPSPWERYCKGQKLGKHINHPDTCEKYIVCIGHGEVMDCPPRTHFNRDLEVCDWPERAGCQDGGSTSNPGPTVNPTQNPNPDPPSPWDKYCEGIKPGTHVKHPDTCEKYIVCNGHGEEMDCAPKTHFSEELQVCDFPERANCVVKKFIWYNF